MSAPDALRGRLIERFGTQYECRDDVQGWEQWGWKGPFRLRVPAVGAARLDWQLDDATQDRIFYGTSFTKVVKQALAVETVRH